MAETAVAETEATEVRVDRKSDSGEVLDTVALDAGIFGVRPNVPLMHQVVHAQLAARRSGTQSTKTRAEVAGGAAKPYRQKGTGRARQGTIRAPQFAGGGVALGPKPRSYAQRTPRKMIRLALHCALSDRASDGKVCLVDRWSFEVPKTKDAVNALDALGIDGTALVVLGTEDAIAERSFANLPQVVLAEAGQLTAYDVLANDWIVFTNETVLGEVTVVAGPPAKKAAAKKSTAASKKAKATADAEAAEDAEDEAPEAAADESEAPVAEAEAEASSSESSDSSTEASADEADAAEASADEVDETETEEDGE